MSFKQLPESIKFQIKKKKKKGKPKDQIKKSLFEIVMRLITIIQKFISILFFSEQTADDL